MTKKQVTATRKPETKPAKVVTVTTPKASVVTKKKGDPGGRPTSYREEYAEQAMKFALLGASDERMAQFFGVAVSTFYLWKKEYPKFSEALMRGKDAADANVAASLYHRALGYSHPEVDLKVVSGAIVKTNITKHYPPDTAAATMWLKNRQPVIWRDKVENVLSGPDGGPIQNHLTLEFVSTRAKDAE